MVLDNEPLKDSSLTLATVLLFDCIFHIFISKNDLVQISP